MGCVKSDVYGVQRRLGGLPRGAFVFEVDEERGRGGKAEQLRFGLFGGRIGAL